MSARCGRVRALYGEDLNATYSCECNPRDTDHFGASYSASSQSGRRPYSSMFYWFCFRIDFTDISLEPHRSRQKSLQQYFVHVGAGRGNTMENPAHNTVTLRRSSAGLQFSPTLLSSSSPRAEWDRPCPCCRLRPALHLSIPSAPASRDLCSQH
jgi:hypothetical protein